jgi:hypothetical protein
MEGLILNDTHNFLLQNYTGEYNGTKFNFKVSKDGRGQIHRIELMDWDGKDMIDLSIDDVFELYKTQIGDVTLDFRFKKHNDSLWYI